MHEPSPPPTTGENGLSTTASPPSTAEMGILDHLRELRSRLLKITVAVVIAGSCSYLFVESIFEWLAYPFRSSFPKQSLVGSGPAEAFMIKLKVAIFAGVIISLPVTLHQVWKFVQPGLYDEEKEKFVPFAAFASFFFLSGVLFCYYVVLPLAFAFFYSQYASIELEPNIRVSEQLSTSINMMLAFGVMFEMPLVAYLLASLGLVDDKTLIGISRYAIVAIFVAAAVLTPPDVVSQFLMAAPLLLLYGLSILIVRKMNPYKPPSTEIANKEL